MDLKAAYAFGVWIRQNRILEGYAWYRHLKSSAGLNHRPTQLDYAARI